MDTSTWDKYLLNIRVARIDHDGNQVVLQWSGDIESYVAHPDNREEFKGVMDECLTHFVIPAVKKAIKEYEEEVAM